MRRLSNSSIEVQTTKDDQLGIRHPKAILFLVLWYIFSSLTLFLNKYIVDMQQGDAGLLGEVSRVL